MSISDVEREDGLVDEPTGSRRERPAESYQSTGVQKQRNTAWGFWLVLAAILVIALVYSVTMLTIGKEIKTSATAIGAMTTVFTVIGTLVGTYFGIKAGLDGQDKVKDTMDRAIRDEGRPRDRSRREYE